MAYLLDANVFIEAANRYYATDICPGFWEWMESSAAAGNIVSTQRVRDELLGREDDLAEWAERQPAAFFTGVDSGTLPHLATLASWVQRQNYRATAIAEFLDSADYYLIASAMGGGHIVVTHEKPSDGQKKVKIPEPCIAHGVEYVNTFIMLRRLGARFDLRPQP